MVAEMDEGIVVICVGRSNFDIRPYERQLDQEYSVLFNSIASGSTMLRWEDRQCWTQRSSTARVSQMYGVL